MLEPLASPTRLFPIAVLIVLFLLPISATAEEIDFDDLEAANDNCCYLSDEYADLGVSFETTDDGSIWDGVSAGDPGVWRLEGTRGPAFLGFNGASYELTAYFDAPVVDFSLDVARAYPSTGAAELRVWGLVDGEVVERQVVPLGGVNQWITVSLESEVDAVRWKLRGDAGVRPYGVDHLRWTSTAPPAPPEPELLEVAIDVVPFGRGNRIHLYRRGVVPVMLYGDEEFAVEDVAAGTLALGPGATPVLKRWWGPHTLDADRDGFFDMLAFFRTSAAGLQVGDEWICVRGETLDGDLFEGCQEVEVVERPGQRRARGHDPD